MKKIEKLLPEHIVGYFNHGLKFKTPIGNLILTEINNNSRCKFWFGFNYDSKSKFDKFNFINVRKKDYTIGQGFSLNRIRPFLKPLKSLTPEELSQFSICFRLWYDKENFDYKQMIYSDIEMCHKLHVDYRGLIDSGLAVEK